MVLAPGSRNAGLLSEEMADRVLDWIKSGLAEVVSYDSPGVRLWPSFPSSDGFIRCLTANLPIPEPKGTKSHWVVVAGEVRISRSIVRVGLALYTDQVNNFASWMSEESAGWMCWGSKWGSLPKRQDRPLRSFHHATNEIRGRDLSVHREVPTPVVQGLCDHAYGAGSGPTQGRGRPGGLPEMAGSQPLPDRFCGQGPFGKKVRSTGVEPVPVAGPDDFRSHGRRVPGH